MYTVLIFLFVLACALMVVSILLQSSKGGGLAASFGGMGSSSAFGPRGAASFLQRVTIVLAILYGLLCIFINIFGTSATTTQESIIQQELNRTLPQAPLPIEGQEQQQLPQLPPEPSEE